MNFLLVFVGVLAAIYLFGTLCISTIMWIANWQADKQVRRAIKKQEINPMISSMIEMLMRDPDGDTKK